ncbi:MAG: hypothetical protein J6O50_10095 [Ruminiclostridium sp.]|nr:hypothetical protein [Ruminiclostridium sp.]
MRGLWDLTAYELEEIISAGRKNDERDAKRDELLAFNIGALVLAAFNAPRRFPKTPEAAFGRKAIPRDGGKSSFMALAEQINKRLERRKKEQENGYDNRRT